MNSKALSFCIKVTGIATRLILASVFFFSLVGAQSPVHAASTHNVNSSSDHPDSDTTDGVCNNGAGFCTLRAAIMQANANNGADTINFADSYTIYPLTPLPALNDNSGATTIKRVGLYVSIVGTNAGATADGFLLSSNGNKIQNLNIFDFGGNGIKITGNQNIIGMDSDGTNDAQEQNQIHTNGANGIYVSGQRNRIAGNVIGINKKPNSHNGIEIANTDNVIGVNGDGVSDSIEGNQITRNTQNGIFVHGGNTIIAGNSITSNGEHGILISLSGQDRVGTNGDGTSDVLEGNLISGNTNGIHVYDSDNTVIAGNKIGGANVDYGIYLYLSNLTIIGTDGTGVGAANEGNLISGNWAGQIYAKATMFTTIAGNKIGTDITGTSAHSTYQGFGIKLENSTESSFSGSRIGTDNNDALESNLISGTGWYGIQLRSSSNNTIAGNIIGLDINGQNPLPNENGIELVNSSTQNIVEKNTIAGNLENGIYLYISHNNRIRGNLIGTNLNGNASVANGLNGIHIDDSRLNVIGTSAIGSISDSDSNLISGNTDNGIKIEGTVSNANLNSIYGNRIGTTANAQGSLPNGANGIVLTGENAFDNTIQVNLFANHPQNAVSLWGTQQTEGNTITANSMIDNGGGIFIQGTSANDYQDLDDGPNGLQNYPEMVNAARNGAFIGINLNFNSTPSKNFNIHVYLNRSCDLIQSHTNQGETYLGVFQVSTDTNGNILPSSMSVAISSQLLAKGPYLLATATDPEGSTSEFSNCIKVEGLYFYNYLPMTIR